MDNLDLAGNLRSVSSDLSQVLSDIQGEAQYGLAICIRRLNVYADMLEGKGVKVKPCGVGQYFNL